MNMSSNGGGLQISKECMVPGYDFWVWFITRATTNIICLKNLICLSPWQSDPWVPIVTLWGTTLEVDKGPLINFGTLFAKIAQVFAKLWPICNS